MNRVWAFLISKPLNSHDLETLQKLGEQFVLSWTAHENKLEANFSIFKNKIILVKVNEQVAHASGCSIDKLTRFIKDIEKRFNVELLNRLLVAFKKQDEVEIAHALSIKTLLQQNELSPKSIIYNTSINNEQELLSWEQELQHTWLSKYLN